MLARTTARPQADTSTRRPLTGGILQRKCACGGSPGLTGECAECSKKREGSLQRSAISDQTTTEAPPIVHEVLRSPGQPLDPSTRAFFEPRFGHDFSQVRVHTDGRSADSARAVNAFAYTVGRDVVFSSGQYAPGTPAGKRLLAHELTHVVQQGMRPVRFETKHVISAPGDAYEQEADRVAALVNSEIRCSSPHPPRTSVPIMQGGPLIPRLQRADCSIKHVEDECNNAAASCKTVEDECKKWYPKPSDIDTAVQKGRERSKALASSGPNAAANMLHFLDNTGAEKVMPTAVFENHAETQKALLKHRQKFLDGAKKRLETGNLAPGALSEQMVYTDTANAFSFLQNDDLGYAVGGYTLCSKARVRANSLGADKFEVTFAEWTVQAFDCYNWDPGKGVGIPGASDTDMCCIENAGKGKHYRIRTDQWKNSYADSIKAEEVQATLPPAAPAPKAPTPAPSK